MKKLLFNLWANVPSSTLNTTQQTVKELQFVSITEAVNSTTTGSSSCPQAVYLAGSTEKQHTRYITFRGRGSVTSWSSWRSFTVTLFWSSGRVPLGNTPNLVITTGWRTLKSRAMADTSEGASAEGSDTVTISISASWPAAGTEGRQRLLHKHTWNLLRSQRADRLFSVMKTGWFEERGRVERRGQTPVKLQHQHFEELVLRTAVFKASFCSWVWFLNYKRAVYYPGDQWKDQGC